MNAAQTIIAAPPQALAKRGIGASSAAAAIGCSEYREQVDAWLEITGRVDGFAGNSATRWGHVLEPVIRAHYVEKHGVTVYVPPDSLFHPQLDFVRATPDGIVVDDESRWLYVGPQVKNVGLRQAAAWADGAMPQDYLVQGVVEMAVTDLPRIDFAVLIGGQEDREVTVWRDPELEADVLEALADFWGYVERDEQPPITGSRKLRSHLIRQIKRRGVIEATPTEVQTLERWRAIAREMSALKAEEARIKNEVLATLAARGGDKLNSPIGTISLSAPRRKTKWKEVAHRIAPALQSMMAFDLELEALHELAVASGSMREIASGIETMRASLAIVGGESFAAVIAANTTTGEASPRRPTDWTANEETDDE